MQGASPSGFAFRSDVAPFTIGLILNDRMVIDFADNVSRVAEVLFGSGII